ncbi:hypothetical protein [Mesorhizobium sp. BE184]|nr:hypothetical protein [Mesorhizobium sp. BE184]MDR7034481.1 hypothetical protein [Mesorhizobium sp. BE184]
MGGYDKSPDYGGPPVTWRTRLALVILMFLVVGSLGAAVWVLF